MGNVPVLKPTEVISILRKLGFVEIRQRGSHKQLDMRTDAARPFPFTEAETFRLSCFAR